MFCGKCGAKLDDDAAFCGECGARVEKNPVVVQNIPYQAAPGNSIGNATGKVNKIHKSKKKFIAVALLAVVCLAAVAVFLITRPGASSPREAAEQFMDGMVNCDADKVAKIIPKKMRTKQWEYNDLKTIINTVGYAEYKECNAQISYEIEEISDFKASHVEDFKEDYKKNYNITISDTRDVTVHMDIRSGDSHLQYNRTVRVLKIGGRWYADINNI